MKYAKRLGFRAGELNVDSLVVSNILFNNENGRPVGRSLYVKIRGLLELEWNVVIHHNYGEANQYVNALTNFGCLNTDIVYYETCPTQLSLSVLQNTIYY